MSCFDNVMGLRGGDINSPLIPSKYGVFVDDLEFINIKNVEAIDSEYGNIENFCKVKFTNAAMHLKEDVLNVISEYQLPADYVNEHTYGTFDTATLSGEDVKRGLRITKKKTALTELFIPSIKVKSENAGTFNIVIDVDGVNDSTIEDIELEAGVEKQVEIDLFTSGSVVDFYIISADFVPYIAYLDKQEELSLTGYGNYARSCGSCGSRNSSSFLNIQGISDDTLSANMIGMIPTVVVQCSMDKVFCLLLPKLKQAYQIICGIELLKEFQVSDRANFFAMNSKETAGELIGIWMKDYDKILKNHKKSLASYIKSVDPICFKCGGLEYEEIHP